jgi:hypothetical protein
MLRSWNWRFIPQRRLGDSLSSPRLTVVTAASLVLVTRSSLQFPTHGILRRLGELPWRSSRHSRQSTSKPTFASSTTADSPSSDREGRRRAGAGSIQSCVRRNESTGGTFTRS